MSRKPKLKRKTPYRKLPDPTVLEKMAAEIIYMDTAINEIIAEFGKFKEGTRISGLRIRRHLLRFMHSSRDMRRMLLAENKILYANRWSRPDRSKIAFGTKNLVNFVKKTKPQDNENL